MPLTDQQDQRLRGSLRNLWRSTDFSTVRQFVTAESAKDEPDFPALKRRIVDLIAERLDEEIEASKGKRRGEALVP